MTDDTDYQNVKKFLESHRAAHNRLFEEFESITKKVPHRFSFREHDAFEFEEALSFFDWDLRNRQVKLDLSECLAPNYQTLSLLVLYIWHLKNQGCKVSVIESEKEQGASQLWRNLGARGAIPVLFNPTQTFLRGKKTKPLLPVRSADDLKRVITTAEEYTAGFDVQFIDTLRYVLSEMLYNTLEHGKKYGSQVIRGIRIPSVAQFTWYKKTSELHFIVADIGMGIKKHIEQTYPGQQSHLEALRLAIQPNKSGTFGQQDPYSDKNNAGMGLFISSNIIKKLKAEMHIVSGDGLLHISPMDVTGKTLSSNWPGTIVLVTVRVEENNGIILHDLMQEFRAQAVSELKKSDGVEKEKALYVNMENYFGAHPVDKEAAIKFKERHLFPAIEAGKEIVLDFDRVKTAPHSFLNALLASPIKRLGMLAYKRIKILNSEVEIRETLDFIFDDNTN